MQTDSLEQLRTVPALLPLSEEALQDVRRLGRLLTLPRGTNLLQQTGLEHATFYLLAGQLRVVTARNGGEIMVGGTTASAALRNSADLLVAQAITPATLLCIETDILDVTMILDQLAADAVAGGPGLRAPTRSTGLVAGHLQSGALSALSPDRIALLLERFEPIEVKRGAVVIREGEPGDYYYVVDQGRCLVTRRIGNTTADLAELRPGDGFGEEALLADTARNATVTMKSDGRLYRLAGEDFNELLRAPLLRELAPTQALLKKDKATWIDVRFPSEYNRDKLPWAINIPLSEIRHVASVLDRAPEYILYCQNGRRSAAAAFLLAQSGFQACVMEGGLESLAATAATDGYKPI
ncbi:MAG: rhodanese-like proteincyclic nucleotide-binding protein [Paucimonas sp.]|nr:rhodanese-like proteincyclic nucleotide-binding protein [Paucimonas sp.]